MLMRHLSALALSQRPLPTLDILTPSPKLYNPLFTLNKVYMYKPILIKKYAETKTVVSLMVMRGGLHLKELS